MKAVRYLPAMLYPEVPGFMAELSGDGSVPALALRFLMLTATSSGEVLHARWREIDRDAAVWTIPTERMKTRRAHRVPLTDAALRILEAVPRSGDNPYLFPGARHARPLSSMALLLLMHGIGYGVNGNPGKGAAKVVPTNTLD